MLGFLLAHLRLGFLLLLLLLLLFLLQFAQGFLQVFACLLIVGPDTAVVRIMWTTHLRGVAGPRMLRDMQYWHRTTEGWRFRSGVHWPYTPEPAR